MTLRFDRWARSDGSAIAITGATGWLGQAMIVQALAAGLTCEDGRLRLFGSSPRLMTVSGRTLEVERLDGAVPLDGRDWMVAHFAFLGRERAEEMNDAAFCSANTAILSAIQALIGKRNSRHLLFSSSGAAAAVGRTWSSVTAGKLYGIMKQQQEEELVLWCGQRGLPLTIARIYSIGGPFMNKLDRYMLSSVLDQLSRGNVVRIEAKRPVFRSFVDVRELCMVMAEAALAADPSNATIFETGGREIVEVADLVGTAAEALGHRDVRVERHWDPAAPPDWYVGDAAGYLSRVTALGRVVTPLPAIISATEAWLRGAVQ